MTKCILEEFKCISVKCVHFPFYILISCNVFLFLVKKDRSIWLVLYLDRRASLWWCFWAISPFKSVIQSGWKLLIHLSFSYIRSVKHLPKRMCLGLKSDPHTLYQSDSSKLDRSVPDMTTCNAIMPCSPSHDIIFPRDNFSDYIL